MNVPTSKPAYGPDRRAAMLFLAGAFAALALPVRAEPQGETRRALLDAARGPCEAELGQPVKFVVDTLRVIGPWAFLHARMQSPDGGRIDYRGTEYEEADRRGHKSDAYAALLENRGAGWTVVAHVTGPTDVAWSSWASEFDAPEEIFPQY